MGELGGLEKRLRAVSCRAPEPSPRSPRPRGGHGPFPHPSLCDLIAAVCLGRLLWDLVSPHFGRPEEPEGQLGPGCLAPSEMTAGQMGDPALREPPAKLCFLLARMGTSEDDTLSWDPVLSCQDGE